MYKSEYRERLENAIEHFELKYARNKNGSRYPIKEPIKIKTVYEFIDAMEQRAKTEKEMRSIIFRLCGILEPPNCTCSHCEHFSTFCFCNCEEKRVPGRCMKNRKYLKRRG